METRSEPTVLDLAELERRLDQRACWYDDPSAYREGVRDALALLREQARDPRQPVRTALAG